jgi:hypothetical protein
LILQILKEAGRFFGEMGKVRAVLPMRREYCILAKGARENVKPDEDTES